MDRREDWPGKDYIERRQRRRPRFVASVGSSRARDYGEKLLWRALGTVEAELSPLQGVDLSRLEQCAADQFERVEKERLRLSREAFTGEEKTQDREKLIVDLIDVCVRTNNRDGCGHRQWRACQPTQIPVRKGPCKDKESSPV